jgi:hypothetical protein
LLLSIDVFQLRGYNGELPTVIIDIPKPFVSLTPIVTTTNWEVLKDWTNFTPQTLLVAISTVINGLDAVRGRPAFQMKLPFTDTVRAYAICATRAIGFP